MSARSRRVWCRLALVSVAGFLVAASATGAAAQTDAEVLLVEVDGPITPVVADFLIDAVEQAEESDQTLVVMLDTPGGLDVSMRDIVQAFLNADAPVVVYVSPAGARAASAGTFITMAAHVAAMAPASSIGAATPVDLQGGEITDKVINDASAFARSVAEERGRNANFAEDTVRDGRSVTATQAVELEAVDLVATDLDDLLQRIDGTAVPVAGGTVALETAGAEVQRLEMGTFRSVLARLADPNLAFIFLSIGTLAIVYEAANPGMGFAGIAGVILLILAFFSLSVLPIQGAGVALLVLAVVLFVAELFVPGVGVLAAGGSIALLLGGLFLFEGSLGISPGVLWPSAIVLGGGSVLASRAVIRAGRRPSKVGVSTMVGRPVEVDSVDGAQGQAFVDGAWWEVESADGGLVPGGRYRVAAVEGLRLIVEPDEEERHDS